MEKQPLSEHPSPKRIRMVGWYDPPRLISIAIRVAISTVFGEFADRREAMAATRPISPDKIDPAYNYSGENGDDFWFDFIADTGDGWNPTYAIARLLAEPTLNCGDATGAPLKRGRFLIMGGDQVYPTASRADYEVRLLEPFNEAARQNPIPSKTDVYAIPGNHDWYDGLSAFLGQFCRRRNGDTWAKPRKGKAFGGRRTQQTRSYFALSLPGGWWLWGADVQLSGYIDQPQIDFFEHVAGEWMTDGSRLILCTGQPIWTGVDIDNPAPTFKNFSYLESIATRIGGHRLCAVLTGDSHHYSRYTEDDRHYITAGGGGAFLHPTHHLQDKCFNWEHPAPGKPKENDQTAYPRSFKLARDPATNEPVTFPDFSTSKKLSYLNLAFAFLNPQYTATLGFACALYMWLLHANAKLLGGTLIELLSAQTGVCAIAITYAKIILASPWPMVLAITVGLAYCYLADFSPKCRRWRVGIIHALCQFLVVAAATCLLARCAGLPSDAWLIILSGIVGGVLAGTMLGTYFLICLNVFGKHWNEAFSALRIEDYKCFLRMRIDRQGQLSIYPIGLKTVPRDDGAVLRNPTLREHLIEGPIVL